jgi:zinc transporter 1/2/3
MLIITLLASIIPKGMVTYRWIGEFPLRLFSCFAGGVFLSALFLDLWPETEEAWEKAMDGKDSFNYPVLDLILCCGFFMVFILEQAILAFQARNNNSEEYSPLLGQNEESSDENHGHSHVDFGHHCFIRTMMLQLALSFHSVFEGVAIGLQTNMPSFLVLFTAVCAHKFIMAFCLGLTLAKTKISKWLFIVLVGIFSLASPFGMVIGMVMSGVDSMTSAVLQALAGGTFLYVTFFEVLPQEFNHSQDTPSKRLLKCLSVLIGFGLMAVVVYFAG